MKTPQAHPEYGLGIVVSDDQFKQVGQILATFPGQADVRLTEPQTSGWIRLVLTGEGISRPRTTWFSHGRKHHG